MGGGGRVEESERPSSSVGESVGEGREEGDDTEFATHSLACGYSGHATCSLPSLDVFGSFYRKCLKI